MALKITSYLKAVNRENRPIIFKINFGFKEKNALTGEVIYKPCIYNSMVKVTKANWDSENNLPRTRTEISEILRLEEVIKDTFKYLENQNTKITPEILKNELDRVLGRETKQILTKVFICDYIENVIEKDAKRRSDNTRKQYKNLKNHLIEFEKTIGKKLTTENFDRALLLQFMDRMKEILNTANSVWKIQKNLKSTLRDIKRNYKEIQVIDLGEALSKEEKATPVDEDNIYLTFDDIRKILKYKVKNECESNVRLILLTLFFTGCRYGDVDSIKPEFVYNEDGEKFYYARFITNKGKGVEVCVPILKPLMDAFKKNGGKPARPISGQKFNDYVKILFKNAKFTNEVKLAYTTSEGNLTYKTNPFNELVSSHIGRRSFVTNLINHVPVTILSKITGHVLTNKSVIFKYNKISLVENAASFVAELRRVCKAKKKEFPIQLID